MPSASFAHSAVAGRPVGEVWDRLQDAGTWSAIGPIEEVTDPVHVDGELRSFRWTASIGPTRYKASSTVVDTAAPHLMRLRLDAGEVTGELVTRLEETGDDRTTIHVALDITSRGLLSTMFFPAITDAVGNGLPDQVEGFAAGLGN